MYNCIREKCLNEKNFKMFVLVITVALITGCSNTEKEIVKTCTSTLNDVANGYKLQSDYKIYAKGNVVEKVETTEIITSDDETALSYFAEYLESTYVTANKIYGGHTNTVTKEDGKVISKTTIDYTVMNINKYVEDNSAMKNYVNSDNKLLLDGVISIYEDLGATCE